jgi:predicted aconitase
MVKLADDEKALLDGKGGPAKQKAMELLVKYAEALNCDRFVATNNIAGVPGSSTLFLKDYYKDFNGGNYEAIFSLFDLDSDTVVPVPKVTAYSCHLQGGVDPKEWDTLGKSREVFEHQQEDEAAVADHGIQIMKTCTPYLAGNVPVKGEHCAWMESSAVVFCNSVIGGRTNTEGRESTSAAMLTGKIPDWGFHRDEFRRGSHAIEVEVPIESMLDWGMLGYFTGYAVEENIPVISGVNYQPNLIRHKHFGAAAASSGGVELYHMVGITPEAPSREVAFGGNKPVETIKYGQAERRKIYEMLNSNGTEEKVDFVMLGCPHASIEQIWEVANLLDGKKLNADTKLWLFTSRSVKGMADTNGYTKTIRAAGGTILTDTCSAIGMAVPKGTKVVALDSAKQSHYLPAMMGIEAWFGTTKNCIDAAITGRWHGELP